jgi:HSP20 family molecular chaperone IbpA
MADLENFMSFVMPAVDIIEEGSDLVVTIDLPGFAKKDINLRITGNIVHNCQESRQNHLARSTIGTGHSR